MLSDISLSYYAFELRLIIRTLVRHFTIIQIGKCQPQILYVSLTFPILGKIKESN